MTTNSKTKVVSKSNKTTKVYVDESAAPASAKSTVTEISNTVKKPRGIRQPDPDSILSQLIALSEGDSYARAERLPDGEAWNDILMVKARMRASMSSQVARANKVLECEGARLRMAIGDFRNQDGETLVVVTVTRV